MARFLTVMLGLASMAAAGLAVQAGEPRDTPIALNIPAQPLGTALAEFAEQAGLQLAFYSSDIGGGVNAPGLKGSFTPRLALDRLLANTPLDYEFVADRSVVIRSRPASAVVREKKKPAPQEPQPSPMEEVVITGTSIRGAVPVGSPVFVFTSEDFDSAGAATAQQFLSTLTQSFGGTRSADTSTTSTVPGLVGDRTFGGSAVDLRGLGSASTLILVNGRRQALSGAAEYVDISLIPLSAVERIEVLLDGASAIYGSDAVGGVVNFILLKDYKGYRTRLRTGTTTQGGGTEYQLAQAAGFGWKSGNALLNYEFYRQEPILDDQRKFTREIPGNNDFISGQTKNSLLLSAGQDVVEGLHVSLDALYSKRVASQLYSVPSRGAEDIEADNSQASAAASVLWQPDPAWSARLDLGSSVNNIDTATNDIFNDEKSIFKSRYTLRYSELQLNGRLFRLPAGAIKLAAGGGYRQEGYRVTQESASSILSRRIGDYAVKSAFAELMIPVLGEGEDNKETPRLAISLAERYESYDSFGHRINPKFGIEWAANDHLKLRGSYGKSFRAPNVQQLDSVGGSYILQNISTSNGAQRIIAKLGNASTLGPETSTSWTVGLDFKWDESKDFTGKITWFDIDYRNRIATIPGSALQTLNDPAFSSVRILRGDVGNADFDALVARALSGQDYRVVSGCPAAFRSGFTCSEPPANFTAIVDRGLRNLSATHDVGMDVSLERILRTSHDAFKLGVSATRLFDYKRRITDQSPDIELVDTIFSPIDLRMVAELGWLRGGWNVATRLNYSDRYKNTAVDPNAGISSWTTLDLSVRYDSGLRAFRLLENAAIIFNVSNIFDIDPPFVEPATQNRVTYDAANADPYGRQVSLTITKSW